MVIVENKKMKILTILIYCSLALQLQSPAYSAGPAKVVPKKSSGSCSTSEIANFKSEYIKLQNAMKFEGKDIKLENGKSIGVGESSAAENSPGQELEKALYQQYKNALLKVGKIYNHMNVEKNETNTKILNENPDLVKFFKAIDTSTKKPNTENLKIGTLLEQLKKVKIKDFELNDEDTYLLNKLMIHSQDRICTLQRYESSKKTPRTAYLEQLSKSSMNKMIESLRSLDKTKDIQLGNEETAISQAIKDSLENLRKIIKDNKNCETLLMNSPLLGDTVQTCNYTKFVKSLSADKFNEIESILHFLNANQQAKNARSDLDWINTQFTAETKTSCYVDPQTNSIYVQNLSYVSGSNKLDSSKISCSSEAVQLKPADCVSGLNFNFEDGLGMKVSSKGKTSSHPAITEFSIQGGDNCNKVIFNKPKKMDEKACKDQNIKGKTPKFDWRKDDKNNFICFDLSSECKDPKIWDDTKGCTDKPTTDPAIKICTDKNVKDKAIQYVWNEALTEAAKCEDQKAKCAIDTKKIWDDQAGCKDKPVEDDCLKLIDGREPGASEIKTCRDNKKQVEDDTPAETAEKVYADKPAPARFQPPQIPTRQAYMLPGMP